MDSQTHYLAFQHVKAFFFYFEMSNMLKLCVVLTSCFLQLCSSLRRKVQKSPQVSQVRLIWVNCWQTSPLFHLFLLRYVTGILQCSTFTSYVNVNYVQSYIAASFRCFLIAFVLVFSLRSFDSNHLYTKLMLIFTATWSRPKWSIREGFAGYHAESVWGELKFTVFGYFRLFKINTLNNVGK